jgi:hypothetical protein
VQAVTELHHLLQVHQLHTLEVPEVGVELHQVLVVQAEVRQVNLA